MTHARLKDGYVRELMIVDQHQCIPSLIFCFKYLHKLEIANANFCQSRGQLPADIANLALSLTDLRISDTKIMYLPKEINQLKYLEHLILSNTGLRHIPDWIGELSSLRFLHLPLNNFSSLPKTLLNLPLRQLTVSENPNLHSIQSLNGHPYLELLNTRQCPIDSIPENLPQLTSLNMADNHLTHLHDIHTLGQSSNKMKRWNFHGNQIDILPTTIASVRNLFQLNLANNRLDDIPDDLFKNSTLRELILLGNPFPSHVRLRIRQMKPNQTILQI